MEWINIKDRQPEDNVAVFVWYRTQQLPYDSHASVKKLRGFETHITHWAYIEPPKD